MAEATEGAQLPRIVRARTPSREREQLQRAVATALRAATRGGPAEGERRDILAFTDMALIALLDSVEETASAWEKRGYWLKADRLRTEWRWVETCHTALSNALSQQEWDTAQQAAARIAGHLADIKPVARSVDSQPWHGAWEVWQARDPRRSS